MAVRWFGDRSPAAIEGFWRVYRGHLDANVAAARALEARGGDLGETVDARVAGALARLETARAGDWAPFEVHLRELGVGYARTGMAFAAWHDITQTFYAAIVPPLVGAFAAEPAFLVEVMQVLGEYMRRSLGLIAESYTDTRDRLRAVAEERHRRVIEAALDPVIAMDAAGTVTAFNAAAEKAFGVERARAIGQPLATLVIPPAAREHFTANIARYLALGTGTIAHRTEVTAARADGSEFPAELALAAYQAPDLDGDRREVTVFVRDLTEQKASEASVALWRGFLDQAHIGVTISDGRTREMIQVNRAYADLLGYTVEELAGFDGAALVAGSTHVPAVTREIQEYGFSTFELALRRKDGTTVPVLASSSALTTRSGAELRLSTIVDYTRFHALAGENAQLIENLEARVAERTAELEHTAAELAKANTRKSVFLSGLSHELRTPLNAIIGFSELLFDGLIPRDSQETTEFLGDILASGRHLLLLVNTLLDLARIEAGRLELMPAPCKIAAIANEVLGVLGPGIAKRRLAVTVDIAHDADEVVLDPARLKQVFYNYISNAIKFTPEGGTLVVRAAASRSGGGGDQIRIEVEDSGPGLTGDEAGRLFGEFEQTEAGRQAGGGTGLGLVLTKRLVEAQGGTVGVHSVFGSGSVFWAQLPRVGRTGVAR